MVIIAIRVTYLFLMRNKKKYFGYDDFYRNLHTSGASIIEFNQGRVPCIYLENTQFRKFVNYAAGRKTAVDTNLDIYHNEMDVFVQINLEVLDTDLEYSFLFHANEMVSFFKVMLDSALIILSPIDPSVMSDSIFAIQLPKREKLEEAFRIISKYTSKTGFE
jgi:hypothetical protein